MMFSSMHTLVLAQSSTHTLTAVLEGRDAPFVVRAYYVDPKDHTVRDTKRFYDYKDAVAYMETFE